MGRRSPLFYELFDGGALMSWESFCVHLDGIRDWAALSEHRSFLGDLIETRQGGDAPYDWRQVDGVLPFGDVSDEELGAVRDRLDARVRSGIEAELSPFDPFLPSPQVRWSLSGRIALWDSSLSGQFGVESALGRRMVLSCPAPRGVPNLLVVVYEETVRAIGLFGECEVPPFDEVWSVVERLAAAGRHSEEDWCCELSITQVGPLESDSGSNCQVRLALKERPDGGTALDVAVAHSPAWPGSPLTGTPLDYSVERRALQVKTPFDDYLLFTHDGVISSLFDGAVAWFAEGQWITSPVPLRPNPLVARAVDRGHLVTGRLIRGDLESHEGPMVRISECGVIDPIHSVDRRALGVVEADKQRIRELAAAIGNASSSI